MGFRIDSASSREGLPLCRALSVGRFPKQGHAVLQAGHQLQRVQRKQEHQTPQALRIVHFKEMVDEVAGQLPHLIGHVSLRQNGAAAFKVGSGFG